MKWFIIVFGCKYSSFIDAKHWKTAWVLPSEWYDWLIWKTGAVSGDKATSCTTNVNNIMVWLAMWVSVWVGCSYCSAKKHSYMTKPANRHLTTWSKSIKEPWILQWLVMLKKTATGMYLLCRLYRYWLKKKQILDWVSTTVNTMHRLLEKAYECEGQKLMESVQAFMCSIKHCKMCQRERESAFRPRQP